ncbi:MAG: DUF554 domain-containing protein [Phascolarctobacterium sp.]|nr:DUF554 domain-containing protein [Phascolarctobacterium sp.]
MPGLGTIVNSLAIVVGAFIGLIIKRGLPEKWQETIMNGIGMSILIIGIQMALKSNQIVAVIFSLTIGGIIGEIIDIEAWLNRVGEWIGQRVAGGRSESSAKIAIGFANASILYCSGAMAIVGSIQDGLTGDHNTLFAKAALDGVISVVLAANMGIGVMISSLSVGIYQGSITLLAGIIEEFITKAILAELTATGGVLIMAIGTNTLGLTKVRIGNMLPALIIVAIIGKFFL